jgi:hypothetical protein
VVTAAGVTLTVFVSVIGVAALVVVWMGLALTGLVVYDLVLRKETVSLKLERDRLQKRVDDVSKKSSNVHVGSRPPSADDRRMKDLEERLKVANDETETWRRTTEEQKQGRLNAERDLEEARRKLTKTKPSLELRGEVVLATDLNSGPDQWADFVSKRFKRGTILDILAESSKWFSLRVFDAENFRRFTEHRRNTDYFISKSNVSSYKERITIPRGDEWFFVVEPAEGNDTAEVRLTIAVVGET